MCIRWLLIATLVVSLCHHVLAQYHPEGRPDPPGTPKRTKTKFSAVPEEAKFLKCDVCKKSVRAMYQDVAELRASRGKRKLTEEDVLDVVEGTCKPFSAHGAWILKTDLVQPEEGELKLVEREVMSRCRTECETVSRACHDTLGDADTDVAEMVYQNTLTLAKMINKVCYDLTDACKRKRSLTKPHVEEKFSMMPEKEYDMFKMIEETNYGGGRGGLSLYSRDDIDDAMGGDGGGPPMQGEQDSQRQYQDQAEHKHGMDGEAEYENGEYYDDAYSDQPPSDWLPWMAWRVQRSSRWVQSLFVEDAYNEL